MLLRYNVLINIHAKSPGCEWFTGKISSLIQSICALLWPLLTCYQSAVNKLESRTPQFEKTWMH